MKYRAIISDLDGTLLNGEHKISEYTKEVIRKIRFFPKLIDLKK